MVGGSTTKAKDPTAWRAINQLERSRSKKKHNCIYTALEDVEDADWLWKENEVHKFDEYWEMGLNINRIAIKLKRSEFSVLLLALDRLAKGQVKPRTGWKIW